MDLLDAGAPRTGRPWPRWVLLAVACLVIVAAAAVVQLAQDRGSDGEAGADPVSLEGSLLLDDFWSTPVELPFSGEQERNAAGTGSFQLELPDRQFTGAVSIQFAASHERSPTSANVFHSWGDIDLRLGPANDCHGSFGWSNFTDPLEGGGSMHLRCDDGAVLAASMVATAQPQFQQAGDDLVVELLDGWYVPGSTSSAGLNSRPGTLPQDSY